MSRDQHPSSGDMLPLRLGRRLLSAFASLRLAIVLLSLFTLCLAGATGIESTYGAGVAQALVYRAWWFVLLLVLLACNVLGAALKKYPWRRHQTGFLVTHAGLLVLLLGGLLTVLCGVEGQMVLIDTPDADVQARLGLGNSGRSIDLDGLSEIDVYRLRRPDAAGVATLPRLVRIMDGGLPVPDDLRGWIEKEWSFPLNPGVFTWSSDDWATRRLPWTLDFLDRLASPVPGFTRHLDGSHSLEVKNFYPHVENDPNHPLGFAPRAGVSKGETNRRPTPALRCTLAARGLEQDFVVAMFHVAARVRLGDALYLVRFRPAACPVPFTLTLQRAWQVKDPGSDRPAWFQSDLMLASAAGDAEPARSFSVSMNRTIGHGLYKVYQTNYRRLPNPAAGEPVQDDSRPISLSGLTVAHDPGLWLKYLGSFLVVAGIATMFWMRAYFFQPRGRAAHS